MWRERGVRAWGEGWWELPITVGVPYLYALSDTPPPHLYFRLPVAQGNALCRR